MKSYIVTIMANLPQNNGEKEYCQKYIALDCENNKIVAEHYTDKTDKCYPYMVLQKTVVCESGCGAILKIRKWQNEGLTMSFLTQAIL